MMKFQVIPLGKVPEETLTEITEELRSTFDVATETSLPQNIPKELYDYIRHQYLAPSVLKFLMDKFKGKVLGIVDEDLYTEDLNFIFGQAQLNGNVAIISIHRLNPSFYRKPEDTQLLTERSVKEAVHEIGHMLGLRHCPNEKCVMGFSNTIADVDRKTKEFCERCRKEAGVYY